MNSKDYAKYISKETLMGPNSVVILEELFRRHPLRLAPGTEVLDLGCGKGLTSMAIAKETAAKVCALDLWISEGDNKRRFREWGVDHQITPVCEDAKKMVFAPGQFQALISVDSYHYFAGEAGFFESRILPFLAGGADVLIAVPGIKNEYSGRSKELLSDWLDSDTHMFKSMEQWKELIGCSKRIESVETWEMDCFETAWNEWFATDHPYANADRKLYESIIKPYSCFVGIHIKLAQ